jgi:hypothetical protein
LSSSTAQAELERMKTALSLLAFALLAGAVRADWAELKVGMDQSAALQCVGMPLLQNRGRGGAEVWTYDRRGHIQFQSGRVCAFEASKPAPAPATPPTAQAKATPPSAKKPVASPRGAVALRD